MAIRWNVKFGLIALGLLGLAEGALSESRGQTVPHTVPQVALGSLDRALEATMATGRPTVAVVTSMASSESQRLWIGLASAPETQELARSGQLAQLNVESSPSRARRMGVTATPTVLVYRKGASGLELAGHQEKVTDVATVVGWLGGLGLVASSTSARIDDSVQRAGLFHHNEPAVVATPQAPVYAPPPSQAPPAPVYAAPPAAAPPQTYLAPVVNAPAAAPVVVSAPTTPIVFQPSAPTIMIGSQPAPNIMVSAAPPQPPTVTMMAAPPAAAPPQNLFLASPPPASPQSGVASGPPAAAPVTYAAAPAAPMLYASAPAAPMMMAPAGPSMAPGSAPMVGLLVEHPNLFKRLLGLIGRTLAKLGEPTLRLKSLQEPAQSPLAAQIATVSFAPASLVPAAAPAAAPVYAPAAPPQPAAYSGPTASPQSPPKKHAWFHHD